MMPELTDIQADLKSLHSLRQTFGITLREGIYTGEVVELYIHPVQNSLWELAFQHGLLGHYSYCHHQALMTLGEDAVIIDSHHNLKHLNPTQSPHGQPLIMLQGYEVQSEFGIHLGYLKDFKVELNTFHIHAMELDQKEIMFIKPHEFKIDHRKILVRESKAKHFINPKSAPISSSLEDTPFICYQ